MGGLYFWLVDAGAVVLSTQVGVAQTIKLRIASFSATLDMEFFQGVYERTPL